MALGEQEGVGHAAADRQPLQLADQVVQEVDLGGDLGAAHDPHDRPLGRAQGPLEVFQLCLHRPACEGGQDPRDPFGRGVGPVGRREGVVHI